MKLVSKEREDGRYAKRYDRAQTPHQRMNARPHVPQAVKLRLTDTYSKLDPVDLLARVRAHQDAFWALA